MNSVTPVFLIEQDTADVFFLNAHGKIHALSLAINESQSVQQAGELKHELKVQCVKC